MTLRELLSCYDDRTPARLILFDREWKQKGLKICFNPGYDLEWVYADDMIELDELGYCRVLKWYASTDGAIRILLDIEF